MWVHVQLVFLWMSLIAHNVPRIVLLVKGVRQIVYHVQRVPFFIKDPVFLSALLNCLWLIVNAYHAHPRAFNVIQVPLPVLNVIQAVISLYYKLQHASQNVISVKIIRYSSILSIKWHLCSLLKSLWHMYKLIPVQYMFKKIWATLLTRNILLCKLSNTLYKWWDRLYQM